MHESLPIGPPTFLRPATYRMADKNMMTDDKFPIQEDVVGVEVWDEDKKKLDKRVNRKLDCHILPWLIIS